MGYSISQFWIADNSEYLIPVWFFSDKSKVKDNAHGFSIFIPLLSERILLIFTNYRAVAAIAHG